MRSATGAIAESSTGTGFALLRPLAENKKYSRAFPLSPARSISVVSPVIKIPGADAGAVTEATIGVPAVTTLGLTWRVASSCRSDPPHPIMGAASATAHPRKTWRRLDPLTWRG
jgi:hypothetical protein